MKFALTCGIAMFAETALAQDLPLVDWSGPFAGASLSMSSADVVDDLDSTQVFSFSADGKAAALQLGYNFQTGALVYGIEGSLAFGSVSGVGECPPPTCAGTGSQPDLDIDRTASLRARIGLARNNMLYFATLGTSTADVSVNDPFQGGSDSQRHRGVLAGVGIDWKVSARLSAGAEYIYGRYDDVPYALIITPDVIGFETQELRLGVKFDF